MSQHHQRADSRRWRKARADYLAAYPICILCHHPGADQVDHIIPISVAPELAMVPANWRPAHGVRGCPTCGVRCNQVRGTKHTTIISPRSRAW